MTVTTRGSSAIDRLLRPRSVAIVGASANPAALGSCVLRNLQRAGYQGEIHLINPNHREIAGRPCVASIDALPDGVDCAVLAIPRASVLEVVAACGRKKIGGVIIFSAGFAEAGEQGRTDQAMLAEIARADGMIVEGPNCLGLVNHVDGAPLTFVDVAPSPLDGRPGVAIVSQSGAMACVLGVSLLARKVGISFSVSTGNEAASGVEDYVEALLEDPHTAAIAMIVEQFRQPKRFLALARRAAAIGKRILLLHPGSSAGARASAATHTGALAGDHQVMRAKVGQAGVVLVDKLEELLDVAELTMRCPPLSRGGAAVMTESGAFKALTLDLCERVGLDLPAIAEPTAAALRRVLPEFIPPSNPLDLTAQALVDTDLYNRTLEVMLQDERYSCVVLSIILTDAATCRLKFPPILAAIKRLRPVKPLIVAGLDEGAEMPAEYIAELRSLGVPFFATAERVMAALAILAKATARAALSEEPPAAIACELPEGEGVLPEYRSKAVLQALDIRIPAGAMAQDLDDAQRVAAHVGFPVALKAQSPLLSHKSDAGGVELNLADPRELAEGWRRLSANVAAALPGVRLDGVLVERMGRRGTELIIGARNDPDWGVVLLVGLGGVAAEALQDVRLLPPELPRQAIIDELHRLKSAALLRSFRGAPPLDVAAVADLVAKLAAFMLANSRVAELDINPVMVYPRGEGILALDALIHLR
jgi:acyl-CoA synthetase (NDP forming)